MSKLLLFLFFITLSIPGASTAKSKESKINSDFKFSGYFEPSYNYLSRSNHFISTIRERSFDLAQNGFTLQQLAITVSKEPPQGLGGLLNLILGRDAITISPAGINPRYFGLQNIGLTPVQAYLQYAIGALTLLGGLYNSPIGQDDYNPTANQNFSQSLLATFAQPNSYIGLKGTYLINEKLSLALDTNNGWDTIEYTSRQKTLEINTLYNPNDYLQFSLTAITGIQPAIANASQGPTGRRTAIDVIGRVFINSTWSIFANYDYGLQTKAALPYNRFGKAAWQGISFYLNKKFNDQWGSSLRTEIFNDANGYQTGVQQTMEGLTFTVTYHLFKQFRLRGEARHDFSNVKSILTRNGKAANNNMQSFALEGLYQF